MSRHNTERWQRCADKVSGERLYYWQRAASNREWASTAPKVSAELGLSPDDARDFLRWLAEQPDVAAPPDQDPGQLLSAYLAVRQVADVDSFAGQAMRRETRPVEGLDDATLRLAAQCVRDAMRDRGVTSKRRSDWQAVFEAWDSSLTGETIRTRVHVDEPDPPAEGSADVLELVEARVKASRRKKESRSVHEREVVLPCEPVAFLVMGDPHLDNPGCDWDSLKRHVDLAKATPGVMAATVGDVHDNWIGRLGRLYHKATVTAAQGWDLSEWLFRELDWFAVVGGNHDAWAHGPGIDPMKWLTRDCGVRLYAPDELRITIRWRDSTAEPFVWLLRHDVRGRSWFHATHGPHKEAMLDGTVHLVTVGHTHEWAQLRTEQRHGRVTNAARVRGYKRDDCYAREKGFHEQKHGESCLVVVDPTRPEPGRVKLFWDIEEGCEWLTWRRSRLAA